MHFADGRVTKPHVGLGWIFVASWDASTKDGPGSPDWEHWCEACCWALDHGGDDDTWRYEVWIMDGPLARVLRYTYGPDDHRYIDPGTGEPATKVDVVFLAELPPPHLRVSADVNARTIHCPHMDMGGHGVCV